MKLVIVLAILIVSCSPAEKQLAWKSFGAEITPLNATPVSDVIDQFELDVESEFKISGELKEVCSSKGCWTTIEAEDGRLVRVTFKDYGFFMPLDAAGRAVIAEGVGFKKVTSVDELRHYAVDAKKSEEEIAAITEPKTEYLFEAAGVLLN